MNVLVINGSPKGERSNTLKITKTFLEGMNIENTHQTDIIDISKMSIDFCRGCYTCWTKTPGKCIIQDDMSGLIEKYIHADVIIWSFPIYYYGIPAKTKALIERLHPIYLPEMIVNEDDRCDHLYRYDMKNTRYLFISTCGFYTTKNNYDGLLAQLKILFGDQLTKIICPEGELFRVPALTGRITEYLSHIKQAGKEYAESSDFSTKTKEKLNELLLEPKAFVKLSNDGWKRWQS